LKRKKNDQDSDRRGVMSKKEVGENGTDYGGSGTNPLKLTCLSPTS